MPRVRRGRMITLESSAWESTRHIDVGEAEDRAVAGSSPALGIKYQVKIGRIRTPKPKRKKVASDRAPVKEKIRALLAECDSSRSFSC